MFFARDGFPLLLALSRLYFALSQLTLAASCYSVFTLPAALLTPAVAIHSLPAPTAPSAA
jgi:hypothetical protein